MRWAKSVAMVAIMTSGVAVPPAVVRAGESEREKAIAAIEAMGGKVERVERDGHPVLIIDLSSTEVTDAGLAHLEGLHDLRSLRLLSTEATDAGLAYLEGLHDLRSLNLAALRVTDAGLAHLAKLQGLESLALGANRKIT